MMDAIDRTLINRLQDGIELVAEPFQAIAEELGISQDEVVTRLSALCDDGTLSRFGPLYDAAKLGGAVTLCAMAVPRERFESVAAMVNALPEVAHNYERAHHLNMWFVLSVERGEDVDRVLATIRAQTGLRVIDLPKLAEYRLDLRLTV